MACVCVWDFTFHVSGQHLDWHETEYNVEHVNTWMEIEKKKILEFLEEHCKKWTFQLERGEKTGKLHFQGRFSLKSKTRLTGLVKLLPKAHFSVTSNENRTNCFYVEKEDTRIKGPWRDTDKKKPSHTKWVSFWKWNCGRGRSLVCGLQKDTMTEELI